MQAERHGIAEVFHTFPQLFREQFRGKGHEVSITWSPAEMLNQRSALLAGQEVDVLIACCRLVT